MAFRTDAHDARLKRRGLIVGTAAVAAAALAKASEREASAANGDSFIVGNTGTGTGAQAATAMTQLDRANASLAQPALNITNTNGAGVQGFSANYFGVLGISSGSASAVGGSASGGAGVIGQSTSNFGVAGSSSSSAGVYGEAVGPSGTYGVFGRGTQNGVRGEAPFSGGYGVFGLANAGSTASPSAAVFAQATGAVAFGVYATSTNYHGLYATTSSPSSFAGFLDGNVLVTGNFVALGTKSAAVPVEQASGTVYRRLYCLEAPESYFQEFGETQLSGGSTVVTIPSDFAATVDTSTYHVYLTEYGDSNGLYVSRRTPTSFEVRAKDAPNANSRFSYCIVAKRRGVNAPRLAPIDVSVSRAQPQVPAPIPVTPRLPNPEAPDFPPLRGR